MISALTATLICSLLNNCFANLEIVSPDELQQNIIEYTTANFGSPGYYPIFGKLIPITVCDCSFTLSLNSYSFGLVYLNSTFPCYFSDIALSVQNSGGIGLIFVFSDDNFNIDLVPSTDEAGAAINILVLGISASLGLTLFSHSNEEIWITYSYGLSATLSPAMEYFLTSNYTTDQRFFSLLQNLNTNIPLERSQFQIGYVNAIYSTINSTSDCISYFCVPSGDSVTGAQKLSNSVVIMNYYNSLTSTNSVALISDLLLDLYSTCQYNYSTDCLTLIFNKYQITPDNSIAVLEGPSITDNASISYFEINDILLSNLNEFETAYCLSSENPNRNCPVCSDSCSYSDLYGTMCVNGCNSTACGYGLLICLEVSSNCFGFMLGDGNCNKECLNDPDCTESDGGREKTNLVITLVLVFGGITL